MRQHYKIERPYWIERVYDIALAVAIGLLLSGVLLWE